MDFVFIHGAPGTGKSSVAKELHRRLNCPWFEFGWIPEFRQKSDRTLTYEEEEEFAFDNLASVAKNYIRHGFENVIITDLRDPIMEKVPRRFRNYRWLFVTLWVDDDQVLKSRVLDETRSSGYRDWEESLRLNHAIIQRPLRKNEMRVNSTYQSASAIAEQIENRIRDNNNGRRRTKHGSPYPPLPQK